MNDSTHKIFLSRLGLSHIAVFFLSRHIQRKGYWVKLPPTAESPTYQERGEYGDDGDLFYNGLRLEVKRIKKIFTGRADWPFKDFMICSVNSFEKAKKQGNPPSFYFIFSADYKHMAQVSVASKKHWTIRKARDGVTGEYYDAYIAPFGIIKWKSIEV